MSEHSARSVTARDRLKVAVLVLLIFGLWAALSQVYVEDGPYQVGDEFTYERSVPVRWRCEQAVRLHLAEEPPPEGLAWRGHHVTCPAHDWTSARDRSPSTYEIQLDPSLDERELVDPGVIRTQRELPRWRAWIEQVVGQLREWRP